MMRRILIVLGGLLALSCLAGCQCGATPAYVKADRQTYEVIAPMYRTYIQADESLSGNDAAALLLLLDTWDSRITAAEESLDAE